MASEAHEYDAFADEIVQFWFAGDQQENYKTKWFPPDASDKQKFMDEYISEHFSAVLAAAERKELMHWTNQRNSFVALIVLLDQFSRHVYRHTNRDQLERNDQLALQLATEFIEEKHWHENLPVSQYVFMLMPLRHTPTAERLNFVMDEIEKKQKVLDQQVDLLDKFRRTTQNRLQHLAGQKGDEYDILEKPFKETDESDMPKNRLYKAMHEFLTKHNAKKYSHLAVSLSGGVDSMVVAYLLHRLRPSHGNFQIVAVHIDYGNRTESKAESDYVEEWCARFGIVFHVRRIDEVRRGKTKRDDYERISREIRYSTYEFVMKKYNAPGMCFGHHRGDVQENVISNMMRGASLLDLNGMSETSIVNGVEIWRPLLSFEKSAIFEFSHRYGIPYFKDTTPAWSTRGKLRNQLMPLLSEMYGEGFLKNLSTLGDESTQCGQLIHAQILDRIMQSVGTSACAVWIDCSLLADQPFFIWKEVFRNICHNKMGNSMIREKPMRELIMKLKRWRSDEGQWVTLKKGNRSFLTRERVLIIFRDQFFQPHTLQVSASPQEMKQEEHDHEEEQKTSLPVNQLVVGHKYTFGPWQVAMQLLDAQNPKAIALAEASPTNLWDLVLQDGIEYVFPNAPNVVLNCDNRLHSLRALDKVITDFMPIITSQGVFDDTQESQKWVHIRIHYSKTR